MAMYSNALMDVPSLSLHTIFQKRIVRRGDEVMSVPNVDHGVASPFGADESRRGSMNQPTDILFALFVCGMDDLRTVQMDDFAVVHSAFLYGGEGRVCVCS